MEHFSLREFLSTTGLFNLTPGNAVMIFIGMLFIYMAIAREWEPYELLPIGVGIILGNLPLTRLTVFADGIQASGILGIFLNYGIYVWNLFPPLVFLGLGAMTEFGPLIANPKLFMLGAASQIGIFCAFWGAYLLGFGTAEAMAIGIIGGADGPTTIYTGAIAAPHLLSITAVTAYSYMAMVALIQPPIMRALTTEKDRKIHMRQLRPVSRVEKIMFAISAMVFILLLVPLSAPLIGMFMLGNLFKESGVVKRLSDSAQNELMNVVVIFLMLVIGSSMSAEVILQIKTLYILALGLIAFSAGTAGGILLAKFNNLICKQKINPLVGSAGVSAVPMAARISQKLGQEADPKNFLLMHALGANVAGVISSAIVAGIFLAMLR